MAIEAFPGFPAFPQDVPTVDLPKISFHKLFIGDQFEIDRYFQVCKDWGFFYLNLQDCAQGPPILNLVDQILEIGQKVFELDLEEKQKYQMTKGSFNGYKGVGEIVVDREGTKDRFESYGLAKDHLVGLKSVPCPAVIDESISILRSYTERVHAVMIMLLDRLDAPLDLPSGTLSKLHQLMEPSDNQLRFLKYPPQPADDRRISLVPHTDFGSITVLFNKLGGLQVLPPQDDTKWSYVRPLPGHATVNLGDAMVKLTRGLLRSNIHRVTYAPGAQADFPRFTLAYLARPDDTTIMRGLSGSKVIPRFAEGLAEGEPEENITIKEWVIQRSQALKTETFKKELWSLTRGTEDQSMRGAKLTPVGETLQMTGTA